MTRQPICQNLITEQTTGDSAICVFPAGHAGDCDFTDAMGMCLENQDCRARRSGWGKNGREHNHN